MKKPEWFERDFQFGIPPGMLPFLIERLDGTIARLEKKLLGESEDILSFQPAEKKWSIKQHVGHLAEVDEVVIRRIDEIIRGISPMAPAVFEPRQDYNKQRVSQVLDYFARNRVESIGKYKMLSEEELRHAGDQGGNFELANRTPRY
jgi:uncharacterized damage-inducible protein DinB